MIAGGADLCSPGLLFPSVLSLSLKYSATIDAFHAPPDAGYQPGDKEGKIPGKDDCSPALECW